MASPATKRSKLSHSPANLADDGETSPDASIPDASFYSLDKGCKSSVNARGQDLPRGSVYRRLAAHGMASRTGRYGSIDYAPNMVKLQTDEMLHNVKSSSCELRMAHLDAALHRIKQIIEDLPDTGPFTVPEAEKELRETHQVQIPFPDPPPDSTVRYTFSYARPSNINVVGSYTRKTALHTNDMLTADLAVTMPTIIFQEKDYLNYRYFHKRAFYLARIAVGFKQTEDHDFHIEYALLNDNHLQPVIIIKSKQAQSDLARTRSRYQIRLLLAAHRGVFSAQSTFLVQNCLRSMPGDDAAKSSVGKPTPFYNSTLRSECCSLAYLELLHNAALSLESFNDACILGNVWLRQRGFGAGIAHGGFGPFEWACTHGSAFARWGT